MPCYYKNCISFLILILILKGFSEDIVCICPEEFVDGKESNMACTVNFDTLRTRCRLSFARVLWRFRPNPNSSFNTLCWSSFPPECSGIFSLKPGFEYGSCGCVNQTVGGEEYTYLFSFQANESWHLNAEMRIVPCNEADMHNVSQKIIGSCKSMTFKTNAQQAQAIAPTGPELSPWRTVIIVINIILLSSF